MPAVELKNISKRFGSTVACDQIDFTVELGEIHCLLGENGAGKSTLMKILFGLYSADAGSVVLRGTELSLRGPSDAIAHGLGMVHQHFMLVDRMTVTENIIAGQETTRHGLLHRSGARDDILALSRRYALHVSPDSLIEDISVGEQQRVEILKALYRRAEILILDEPTAVLTPQETAELFSIIRKLKQDGKTIILITHKLRETMAISDRVSILRDGRCVGTLETAKTSPEELARMMVGREVLLRVEKTPMQRGESVLEIKDLEVDSPGGGLHKVSLELHAGEILGIAGVEGNGQLELEEALLGLREIRSGSVVLRGKDITGAPTKLRRMAGLAHIPSDRLRRGLVERFGAGWNLILGSQWQWPFARRGVLQPKTIEENARTLIRDFDIRGASGAVDAGDMSGGNQQKLVLARELSREPEVILACQPTRGVDVGAIEYIHNRLVKKRDQGKAVLLISAELDEVRALSDRILVMYEGQIIAERPENCDESELGLLMAGHTVERAEGAAQAVTTDTGQKGAIDA